MAHATSRLVGRAAELERLADAVAAARAGARTLVVIEGDAGLGKSRLVAEALATQRDPKDAVGIGYGVELNGPETPYRVTTDLLRTLARDVGVEALREAAGPFVSALRPLHPGLADDGDLELNPARVLPAFVATLEQLGTDRLVWLVVEDLAWVDGPTRDLLSYVVRVAEPSQLLILISVRTHDPATDPAVTGLVDSWERLVGVSRLALNPLTRSQVAELVVGLTEGVTQAQVDSVVVGAQGSPLLTEQLIAAGIEEGPPGAAVIANPMLARIRRLDPDALRLVQVAALGEGHLEHRLLRLACDVPEDDFDAAVDEALQTGLLTYRPTERQFGFAHPLLRQATEETLTPGDRLRGHRRWGMVLSAPENHRGDPQLLIAAAYHWSATDDDADTFAASLAAARETVRLGAATQTSDLLVRAWGLWNVVPDAASVAARSRDDLLLDVADALQSADRLNDLLPILDRELGSDSDAPRAGAGRLRRLCLRMFADEKRTVLGIPEDGTLMSEALEQVEEILAAPPVRLLLPMLSSLGWYVRWTDVVLADRLFDRALAVSQATGRPFDIAFASSQVAQQRAGSGRHEEALAVCASALEVCRTVSDYMDVERMRGGILAQSGQLTAGLAQLERALARLPDPQLLPRDWVFTALVAIDWRIAAGDWDGAAALLATCENLDIDEWAVGTRVLASASTFACLRGDVAWAEELAEEARSRLGRDEESAWDWVLYAVLVARARVSAARGEHRRALGLLEPILRAPGKEAAAFMWPHIGLAAEFSGDHTTTGPGRPSEEFLGLLTRVVEEVPRSGPFLGAWYRHARADLARAQHLDTASTWSEVCDGWRGLGHVKNLGAAAYRLADAQFREGDTQGASAALTEAWEIATRIGAGLLRDAAVRFSRRARIPIKPSDGRGVEAGQVAGRLARLTNRELEVLRQVASGKSNGEIAATLFMSPKTVSVHVSRILAKFDATSRTQATAVALAEGLDVEPL